jgi:hypothetical protein
MCSKCSVSGDAASIERVDTLTRESASSEEEDWRFYGST